MGFQRIRRAPWWALGLVLFSLVWSGCKERIFLPTERAKPNTLITLSAPGADEEPAAGQSRILGKGWYPQVAVDSRGRIHVAYTDADRGDVLYGVSEVDSPRIERFFVVEERGAVGGFLQLALGPGDVPYLSYYHQDERTLRLAHRPADLPALKAAGVNVDLEADPKAHARALLPGQKGPRPPDEGMGEGWHGEDVAFGDQVGMGGALAVDEKGVPHLTYYTRGERFRYATRPSQLPVLGPAAQGQWDKITVDEKAGGSHTMTTSLFLTSAGDVVVSYCHWNYVQTGLRVARLLRGAREFNVLQVEESLKKVDGWHSALLAGKDGLLQVFSVATGTSALIRRQYDPRRHALVGGAEKVLDRPGAVKLKKATNGDIVVFTRGHGARGAGDPSAFWLVRMPKGSAEGQRRILLDDDHGSEPWLDLALLPDGRAVALWHAAGPKALRMMVEPSKGR
jgi:hypothetical protein